MHGATIKFIRTLCFLPTQSVYVFCTYLRKKGDFPFYIYPVFLTRQSVYCAERYGTLNTSRFTFRDKSCYFSWQAVLLFVTNRVTFRDNSCYFSWQFVLLFMTSLVTFRDKPCYFSWQAVLLFVTSGVIFRDKCYFSWQFVLLFVKSRVTFRLESFNMLLLSQRCYVLHRLSTETR